MIFSRGDVEMKHGSASRRGCECKSTTQCQCGCRGKNIPFLAGLTTSPREYFNMKPKSRLPLKQQLDIYQQIITVYYKAMKSIWVLTGRSDINDESIVCFIERISSIAMKEGFALDRQLQQPTKRKVNYATEEIRFRQSKIRKHC